MLVAYSYYCHLLILIGHPCNKMNVAGFPFRLQIYDDFLKGAAKK